MTVFEAVTDPSPVDTAAGFTYAWNVTKNGAAYATGTSASLTFTPNDNATYAVDLAVTDNHGGVGHAPQNTVSVFNVAPTATLSNNGPVNEGSPATV